MDETGWLEGLVLLSQLPNQMTSNASQITPTIGPRKCLVCRFTFFIPRCAWVFGLGFRSLVYALILEIVKAFPLTFYLSTT